MFEPQAPDETPPVRSYRARVDDATDEEDEVHAPDESDSSDFESIPDSDSNYDDPLMDMNEERERDLDAFCE
jgi:hypothetical protein